MASDGPSIVKRAATVVVVAVAFWFAVQAGEFSSWDLLRQRRQMAQLTTSRDSLRHLVDSLKQYENKLEHDPVTQERLAREMFGMIRGNKEILYRFADPPDTSK